MPIPEIKPGGQVLRLRIQWRPPDEWTVVKRVELPSKTLLAHRSRSSMPKNAELTGFWYETTTESGDVVYRRFMSDPTAPHTEVFDDKGGASRVDVARQEALFDVLVPDLPDVAEVKLFSNPRLTSKGPRPRSGDRNPVVVFKARDGSGGSKGKVVVPGFTTRYNIDRLVYWEATSDVISAIAREKQIKGWLRRKKIELINSMNPDLDDLAADWFD